METPENQFACAQRDQNVTGGDTILAYRDHYCQEETKDEDARGNGRKPAPSLWDILEQVSERGRHDQHGSPRKGAFEPTVGGAQDGRQPGTVELELVSNQQQESHKPPQARRDSDEQQRDKSGEADSLQESPVRPVDGESREIA